MHDDLAEQLDAYLIDDADTLPDRPDLFDVTALDADTADRIVRAIARRRRNIADAEQIARTKSDRIAEWLDDQRARNRTDGLEEVLARYHAARLELDPKLKTIRLPAGELRARAAQPRWVFDEATFLEWATEHLPEAVRTHVAVDRIAAKKLLGSDGGADHAAVVRDTGELAPGVTVLPQGMAFAVVTNVEDVF